MRNRSVLTLAFLVGEGVWGRLSYTFLLPNVPLDGQFVGHGPDGLNSFGRDFRARGQWTDLLCRMDSDHDGMTNGEELGDPNCVWRPGQIPERTHSITNPGIFDIPTERPTLPRVTTSPTLHQGPTAPGLNITCRSGDLVPVMNAAECAPGKMVKWRACARLVRKCKCQHNLEMKWIRLGCRSTGKKKLGECRCADDCSHQCRDRCKQDGSKRCMWREGSCKNKYTGKTDRMFRQCRSSVTDPPSSAPRIQLSLGRWHTCALLMNNNSVYCWGDNPHGELGDGSNIRRPLPVKVKGLNDEGISKIAVGDEFSCALMKQNEVKCWGANYYDQLGTDAGGQPRNHPVVIRYLPAEGHITDMAVGANHVCVIVDGQVICWGSNEDWVLGRDDVLQSPHPLPVQGVIGARKVACGNRHSCATLQTGEVKCWGNNRRGQLGDGTEVNSVTAVTVVGLNDDVAEISAGVHHTCVLLSSGGIKCWGENSWGQLGDGNYDVLATVAVSVIGLTSPAVSVSSGDAQSCAVLTSGLAKCWGNNEYGRLGDGTQLNRHIPVSVQVRSVFASVSAGDRYTCGASQDGHVMCWGLNDYGQIGDGTIGTVRLTPVNAGL